MLFGAMRIGAVPVPVNARYKARELSYVVAHAGMHLLLLDPQFAPLLEDAELPDVVPRRRRPRRARVRRRRRGGERRRARAPRGSRATRRRGDHPLHVGDDREPEGLRLQPRAGWRRRRSTTAGALELTPADRFWTPLPLFHVSGLVTLLATLAAPCALVHVGRRFDPGPALEQLERERCTLAFPAFETIWLAVQNEPLFDDDRPALAAARDRRRLAGRAAADAGAAALRDAGLLVREHGVRRLRLDRPHRPTRSSGA